MSDTPAELDDLRKFWGEVRMRKGQVLLHGLGLGCAVRMALQAGAEHVVVLEIDQDLIDYVGPHLDENKVTIVQGDVFDHKWPAGYEWSVVWHDIWDDLCADNLTEMRKLHRKFGGRSGWQGSWSRDYLEGRA